ncbi:hypothetical protein DFH09DRAFT_1339396 [Mycena vulgaris]|nr:hypothetical protein DFH09DRAFT_1339396 [Mycena vulgaris]
MVETPRDRSPYHPPSWLALLLKRTFPKDITELAAHIKQPRLPELVWRSLHDQLNPDSAIPSPHVPLDSCPYFDGRISVFLSAGARFYAPNDLCGADGMSRERIRDNCNWHRQCPRCDTVFVVMDSDLPGMPGMAICRVLFFFSFTYSDSQYPCTLVHWHKHVENGPDDDTGMRLVAPDTPSPIYNSAL